MSCAKRQLQGFSLVEIALVLLMLGILMRTLVGPLTGAQGLLDRRATSAQLDTIRDSLIAHVVATGVLPCPVSPPETVTTGNCTASVGGVPARVLGLAGPTDAHGQLLDRWHRPFQYAVSLDSHAEHGDLALPDWTSPGEASVVGLPRLRAGLTLCSEPYPGRCPAKSIRAANLVFVVLSLGKDGTATGSQSENLDNDQQYVLQAESVLEATRFDDQLVWSTAPDIMYWMLRSGWLP